MKTCSRCRVEKDGDEFYELSSSTSENPRYSSICKECNREDARDRYASKTGTLGALSAFGKKVATTRGQKTRARKEIVKHGIDVYAASQSTHTDYDERSTASSYVDGRY
jgi:hypothetical protein